MVRHCAVKGCYTDSRYDHNAKFFKFPGPIKKADLRKQWIANVNRRNNDKTRWQPKPLDVVCYKHFVEEKPTVKYPVPQVDMGHNFVTRVTGRPVPATRKKNKPTKRIQPPGKENQNAETVGMGHLLPSLGDQSTNASPANQLHTPEIPGNLAESRLSTELVPQSVLKSSHPVIELTTTQVPAAEFTSSPSESIPPDELPAELAPTADLPSSSLAPVLPVEVATAELASSSNNTELPVELGLASDPQSSEPSSSLEEEAQPELISQIFVQNDHLIYSWGADHTYAKSFMEDPAYNPGEHNKGHLSEIASLRRQVQNLKGKMKEMKRQPAVIPHDSPFSHKVIEENDQKTRQFTGFPTYKAFITVFERRIRPRAELLSLNHHASQNPWHKGAFKLKPGPNRELELVDEFLLVMMRLRLGLLEADLAERFNIKAQQVSRIIGTWLPCLAKALRRFVKMPPKEQVHAHMPKVFRLYPKTRVIIDCTEVFIERPSTLLARQQTWSTYKHHNTAKALVGITPSGGITFISKVWGGRASDKHIVKNSGFLDTLEPYDQVMADRGFDIAAELAEKCCTLNIPPFTRGKSQLSRTEVEKHRKISSLRIHVERAIERLKNFRILQGVFPLRHIHMLDDILLVCAAVVNIWPPIVSS